MSSAELLCLIEDKREQLNRMGENESLINPDVVQLSQFIDLLLNLYHQAQTRTA
ncbi:Spo0E like sporulation regulatory protein [Candidatus Desulfosporosinus infrequens]|uniref:Spo0E like sporulation regulatory protein n=1 Tax=Candidatus Desulfosporosinus infrequens TaxID=2043169 RepID=A0A2U3LP08_9FIRM|nr:Spo0E like sporulation regulatory protein [Candidatus Desulfosporosinus infrequens]